jgi:hypothetical protein
LCKFGTKTDANVIHNVIILICHTCPTIVRHASSAIQFGLVGGTPFARYLKSFFVDLYLSAYEKDVEDALKGGIAAGVINQNNPMAAMQKVAQTHGRPGTLATFPDSPECKGKQNSPGPITSSPRTPFTCCMQPIPRSLQEESLA